MADPLMQSHGLQLHHATLEDVHQLLANLSKENLREIDELYEDEPERLLMEILETSEMSHVVKVGDEVIAFCGVKDEVMWTMFSTAIRKYWRSFVRASPKLINFYHCFYDPIHCYVWSENTFIHNWLVHLGFVPHSIYVDDNDNRTVHFVRCNYTIDHVHSDSSRPVMH